jgi:dihydrolipoamide dehydrogenase
VEEQAGRPGPRRHLHQRGLHPSKALLQSSEHFEHAGKHFADHGIGVSGLSMDVAKMLGRKDTVVKQNNDGILYLFKKNKVSFFHGRGAFASAGGQGYEIKVSGASEGDAGRQARHRRPPAPPPRAAGTPFDEEPGAVQRRRAAHSLRAEEAGAGRLRRDRPGDGLRVAPPGAEVTVLEALPTFLGAVDQQIAKEAKKAFDKQGLKIELGVKVGEIKPKATACRWPGRTPRAPADDACATG